MKLWNAWFSVVFRRKKLQPRATVQGFSKCLSTAQLIHLGIGATLGAGTYVVTGQVAANIAGPAVVISFTIAAITSILSGLCYAEFGARVPQTTGSAYTYSYLTVGEVWAFVIGWNLILEYMIGTAADAAALSGSFDYAIGYRVKNWTLTHIGAFDTPYLGDYPDILSFTFTIIVTIVLAFGVRESAWFTVSFNILNIVVVLFIIILGSIHADTSNWTTGAGFFPYGASGVISGAATCFYAFVGFDIIATTGEEAKNPSKSIPVAIVASLVIVFVAYFGVSTVLTLMVRYDQLDKLAPIPAAFKQRGLSWATWVISLGAICGLSSSLLGNLFPLPRIIYAMSKDGLLFKMFQQMSSKTEVPVNATVYPGILTAIFALCFDLEELVEMMSIGTLLAYTLVSLCVLILRYQPDNYSKCEMEPLLEGESLDSINEVIKIENLEWTSEDILDKKKDPISTESKSQTGENSETKDDESKEQNPKVDSKTESPSSLQQETVTYSPTHPPDGPSDFKDEEFRNDEENSGEQRSGNNGKEPTELTGRIVTCTCLLLFLWFFGFNSTLLFAFDQILEKQIWPIFLLTFFGILILISIGVIYGMPQSSQKFGFMAPCVPALPIIAIYANTFLMLKLSNITWIRFGVWMAIGEL